MQDDEDPLAELDQWLDSPGPQMALSGLESYLDAIENQLEYLNKQYKLQSTARLNRDRDRMHEDDIDDEKYRVAHLTEDLFPRLFRGAGLVTLWAVFESSVTDWADYVKSKLNQEFALDEVRVKGGDFLSNAENYFQRVLTIPLFKDREVRRDIVVLKALRNAIVHDNGRVDGLPQDIRNGIKEYSHPSARFEVRREWKQEYMIPTKDCLGRNYLQVKQCLESLSERVLAVLHPKPVKGVK